MAPEDLLDFYAYLDVAHSPVRLGPQDRRSATGGNDVTPVTSGKLCALAGRQIRVEDGTLLPRTFQLPASCGAYRAPLLVSRRRRIGVCATSG